MNNTYIYLGYKEGKHWCKEVNSYEKPSLGHPKYKLNHIELYHGDIRIWQAAESQLKEFEIENKVLQYNTKSIHFNKLNGFDGMLEVNDKFTGQPINGKVRVI
jgi:hypothetical protein